MPCIEAAFEGGEVICDGRALLLKPVEVRLGLTRAAARAFVDDRRRAIGLRRAHSPLAPRVYDLRLGWSDMCDHKVLRRNLSMPTRYEMHGTGVGQLADTQPGRSDGCPMAGSRCRGGRVDRLHPLQSKRPPRLR